MPSFANRFITKRLHPVLISLGALFGASGIFVSVQRYREDVTAFGPDWWTVSCWYVLSHAGTGLALLLLSAAYAILAIIRPGRVIAPFAYVISYIAVGVAFYVVLLAVGKSDGWNDVGGVLMWGALWWLGPALVLASALLWWVARGVRTGDVLHASKGN